MPSLGFSTLEWQDLPAPDLAGPSLLGCPHHQLAAEAALGPLDYDSPGRKVRCSPSTESQAEQPARTELPAAEMEG